MNRFLRDLPIRRKLEFMDIVTTAAALVMACGAFVVYDDVTFRRAMVRDLSITAEMIGFNSASAISFDDVSSAVQTLNSLEAHPHIQAACIFDIQERPFAGYVREPGATPIWPKPLAVGARFERNSLRVVRRISVAGETVGTIYIESDLNEISARSRRYVVIAIATMVVSTLAAFLLGKRLQRLITLPVSVLANTMANVASGRHRCSIRARKIGNDELGGLTDGFNHMLAQIQAREDDLRRAQAELESRVRERTRELSIQISERQRTEEERDRFFTLSLDLFCIATFDGVMRRTNRAFDILGFTEAELRQMTYLDLIHSEDRAAIRAELGNLAGGTVLRNYEVRMRTAHAGPRWFAWSIKAAPEDACFYACGRDISEQKRAQAEREALHREFAEISRRAGMAEVATSVLHNVGNVLNSVNVSAGVVSENLRGSRIGALRDVCELLGTHKDDLGRFLCSDPRGRRVPEFLEMLAEHLDQVQATVQNEMHSLRKNIDHIKEIVAMQQSYARVSGVTEPVELVQLVEDAVQMNGGAFERYGITLEREFIKAPTITVEKHKLLQILVNILRNARHACAESEQMPKRITIRVTATGRNASIEVTDNGVGIAPENLTRIFNHGFTTRRDGHGFGLHSGALAIKELGGSIQVHSAGRGHGASFTVVVPINPPNSGSGN